MGDRKNSFWLFLREKKPFFREKKYANSQSLRKRWFPKVKRWNISEKKADV